MENPRLLKTPFCIAGIKNNIPDDIAQVPSNKPELASIEGGFPGITMQPKKAGGLPPWGGDFNGIFYLLSQHIFFLNQGCRYKFDQVLADAIDGYSMGTILQGDGADTNEYISTVNNNKINFNTTPSSIGVEWMQYNMEIDEDALKRLFISYEASVPSTKQPSEIIYAPIYGLMQWDTATSRYVPDGVYLRSDDYVGNIIVHAGRTPPDGTLVCNGGAYSRTTYAALFAVIGTTHGTGDGLTTFNLPNYADGDAIIAGVSANVGTSTLGQMPIHAHSVGSKTISHGNIGSVDVGGNSNNGWGSTGNAGAGTKNLAAGLKTLICIRFK